LIPCFLFKQQSVAILDSWIEDFLEKLAEEASLCAHVRKQRTLTFSSVLAASRILMPKNRGGYLDSLQSHAIVFGHQALIRYENANPK
jgi:hypothetical protein